MGSTFHGLEVARRGLTAQQAALHTTGHNISNANTPDYTRQRVNFVQTEPYPAPAVNRVQMAGQLGTGVEPGTIERVREQFLDVQYRGESTKLGYWETRADAVQKMEEVMNEPSEEGLAKTMDRFWEALQDLTVNPSGAGARSVVRQRAVAVAETFSYLSSSLKAIQGELKSEIDITVKEINSIAEQLNNVNKQIKEIEPHGYLPNDLYDERDRLLDQLSKIADIEVSYRATGGNAASKAEGIAHVQIRTGEGLVSFVDAESLQVHKVAAEYGQAANGTEKLIIGLRIGNENIPIESLSLGKLKGLIEANGYVNKDGNMDGLYANMVDHLDEMAFVFVKEFNTIHEQGYGLAEDKKTGVLFFNDIETKKGAASLIDLSSDIKKSTAYIAAAATNHAGDSVNAAELAKFRDFNIPLNREDMTLKGYYETIIGQMAVEGQHAERLKNNTAILIDAVDARRQSMSAVSLDEEMTNLIQFQHAYNASARMITMIDQMLDTIVNRLGTGGR